MLNYKETIIHQYDTSEKLISLIESFNSAIDPQVNFNAFLKKVWNIDTATDYGLDIWGRIVGVSRSLLIPGYREPGLNCSPNSKNCFDGTLEIEYINNLTYINCGPSSQNFFGGNLATPEQTEDYLLDGGTDTFYLNDDQYRALIIAKAIANISNASPKTLNKVINTLFPNRGRAWLQDLGNMAICYNFEFDLDVFEKAIISQSKVLPSPAGVKRFAMFGSMDTILNCASTEEVEINYPVFLTDGSSLLVDGDAFLIDGYETVTYPARGTNFFDGNLFDYTNNFTRIR